MFVYPERKKQNKNKNNKTEMRKLKCGNLGNDGCAVLVVSIFSMKLNTSFSKMINDAFFVILWKRKKKSKNNGKKFLCGTLIVWRRAKRTKRQAKTIKITLNFSTSRFAKRLFWCKNSWKINLLLNIWPCFFVYSLWPAGRCLAGAWVVLARFDFSTPK